MWYCVGSRKSCKTTDKKQAEKFAKAELNKAWEQKQLGQVDYTWSDLVHAYTVAKGDKKSFSEDEQKFTVFGEFLGRRDITKLSEITTSLVADFSSQLATKLAGQTVNGYLMVINLMLKVGAQRSMLVHKPVITRMKCVPKHKVGEIPKTALDAIIKALPAVMQDIATLGANTGLRISNACGLRWEWINKDRTVIVIPSNYTKTQRVYTIPLNSVSQAVISKNEGKDKELVFVNEWGRAVTRNAFRNCWQKAREAAGYSDFRPHDLRHTFASIHVRNGTPDRILAALGGWSGTKMLDRYAHLRTEHLAEFAENSNIKS